MFKTDLALITLGALPPTILFVVIAGFLIAHLLRQQERYRAKESELGMVNAELERLVRDLETTRDQAEASSQAKSRFLANMSHELRTPLHGILGYAQLLHLEGHLNGVQDARVDAMLAAGEHLLQMINKVLDLSQIETGGLQVKSAEFDLHRVASNCVDVIRPGCLAKAVKIALIISPDVPRLIVADVTRLQQIILNLMGNAAKFTARGSVELRLRTVHGDGAASDRMLRIEVADTGPGIPPDQRQRLFKEFERLGAAITDRIEGAGLGLAISVRFAAVMGGRIGHEDNPGGGSVFWLEVPLVPGLAERPIQEDPANTAAQDHPASDRRLRVLVVDDVAMNRDIARAFLRSVGHDVVCAEGGAEAVEAVVAGEFDVVLMDVRMPEVDGLEATRRIRALPGKPSRVPIVALTAQALNDHVDGYQKAGMDAYLVKPFAPETLVAAAEKAAGAGHVDRSQTLLIGA